MASFWRRQRLKVGRDTAFRTSRSREFQPVMADGKKDF